MPDLYKDLGVSKGASQAEIKKQFKQQAGKCHPDKHPDNPKAKAQFQRIQHAYAVLKDESKREHYDRTGEDSQHKPPSIDDHANGMISEVFLNLASTQGFVAKDYISETRKIVQNSLRQCIKEKRETDVAKQRLSYLIDHTAANDNLVGMLTGHLDSLNHKLEQAKQGEKVMGRALELLDEFRYTGTTPGPVTSSPWNETDPYVG